MKRIFIFSALFILFSFNSFADVFLEGYSSNTGMSSADAASIVIAVVWAVAVFLIQFGVRSRSAWNRFIGIMTPILCFGVCGFIGGVLVGADQHYVEFILLCKNSLYAALVLGVIWFVKMTTAFSERSCRDWYIGTLSIGFIVLRAVGVVTIFTTFSVLGAVFVGMAAAEIAAHYTGKNKMITNKVYYSDL
jgi:hypothetical protein